jgi:DNA-binding response OmpR family regulator
MSWIVLWVSDDAASLLLPPSILELAVHNTLIAADADVALEISNVIAIDYVVVDCKQDATSVTRRISRARLDIPILFVSDRSEVQLQWCHPDRK